MRILATTTIRKLRNKLESKKNRLLGEGDRLEFSDFPEVIQKQDGLEAVSDQAVDIKVDQEIQDVTIVPLEQPEVKVIHVSLVGKYGGSILLTFSPEEWQEFKDKVNASK